MKIDITKPVKTRDGQNVEIISDRGRGHAPLLGYLEAEKSIKSWNLEGQYSLDLDEHPYDLVQHEVRWINIYSDSATGYRTRARAHAVADLGRRIAFVKVDFTHGQFDEE